MTHRMQHRPPSSGGPRPVTLYHQETGSGEAFLILHGLLGASGNWRTLSRNVFGERYRTITPDLRNHGQSFHVDDMNYPAMASDVAELLDALDVEPCRVLGHSMGGKVAMRLAVDRPDLVTRLAIADIAPVAYAHHYDDLIEPILALPLDDIESRPQADHRLRQHIPEDPLRAFLLQNLAREGDHWRWRVNWEVIQRDMEWLTGVDMPGEWRIEIPTLFIRGDQSDYIGEAEIEVIREHFSDVRIETISGAGHWLHAEQPEAFTELLLDFMRANRR